jgi:penicillin-binding protein 1C
MEGVSGVTGAGPLLHRAVMAVSRRVPPGSLVTPAEVGAVSVPVCRLSGLRATAECAALTEWFVPGTEPGREDDWERGGVVTLPDEYREWSRQGLAPARIGVARGSSSSDTIARRGVSGAAAESVIADRSPPRDLRLAQFRIVSPAEGDRYSVPAGVESRYATVALRASGVGADRVRWWIDGKPQPRDRWVLTPGRHEVRAVSARGDTSLVKIVVER